MENASPNSRNTTNASPRVVNSSRPARKPSSASVRPTAKVAAVPEDRFTWKRASNVQLEGGKEYALQPPESLFFEECFSNHLQSLGFEDAIAVQISFQQLQPVHGDQAAPAGLLNVPDRTGFYETFECDSKTYVLNPQGQLFQSKSVQAWPFYAKFVFMKHDEDAVQFELLKNTSQMIMQGFDKTRYPRMFQVTIGTFTSDYFMRDACRPLQFLQEIPKAILVNKWPKDDVRPRAAPRRQVHLPDNVPANDDILEDEEALTSIHEYRISNHKMQRKSGKRWVNIASFAIVEVLDVFKPDEQGQCPIKYRLLVSRKFSDTGNVIRLVPEENRSALNTSNCSFLQGEVMVDINSTHQHEIHQAFSNLSHHFHCIDLSAMVLRDYISEYMTLPDHKSIIPWFGRQPNGYHVFKNACYKDGVVYRNSEKGFIVLQDMFPTLPSEIKLIPQHYPAICIIPYPWARHCLFLTFWNLLLPKTLHNNTPQAMVTFGYTLAMLHCESCLKQLMVQQGPSVPVQLGEKHTGKSKTGEVSNSFGGWRSRRMINAMAASIPALSKNCSIQNDIPWAMDEMVNPKKDSNLEDAKWKPLIHSIYGGSPRVVCGKQETPGSTFIVSTNHLPNARDAAFIERIILFKYDNVSQQTVRDDSEDGEWLAMVKLISALQPDFENIKWNGEVDVEHIKHCCDYLRAKLGANICRVIDAFGTAFYYTLILDRIAEAENSKQIFEYVLKATREQRALVTAMASKFCLFLKGVQYCRTTVSPLRESSAHAVFHHNLRTTVYPEGWHTVNQTFMWALRLEPLCTALSKWGFKFKMEDLEEAVKQLSDSVAFYGRCEFYNVRTSPWPLTVDERNEHGVATGFKPLPEEELEASCANSLSYERCLWVDGGFVHNAVNDRMEEPFDFENDLFYRAIVEDDWTGFRVISQCAFAQYIVPYGPGHVTDFPPSLWPTNLAKYFSTDWPTNVPPDIQTDLYGVQTSPDGRDVESAEAYVAGKRKRSVNDAHASPRDSPRSPGNDQVNALCVAPHTRTTDLFCFFVTGCYDGRGYWPNTGRHGGLSAIPRGRRRPGRLPLWRAKPRCLQPVLRRAV